MNKSRWYLLQRKENGFDVFVYELIRWKELKNWIQRGWKVNA